MAGYPVKKAAIRIAQRMHPETIESTPDRQAIQEVLVGDTEIKWRSSFKYSSGFG
jgi:hypothetical protein